jgi:hypothetical protein
MSTNKPLPLRKDTGAWIMQTWLAFLIAVGISVFGVLTTPGDIWTKGYLFMSLAFVLSSTFTLSKTLRDNRFGKVDTSQWIMQVWLAFMLSAGLSLLGVMNLPGEAIYKSFGLLSLAFAVTSSFTLSKTIRDNQEAAQFEAANVNRDGALTRDEMVTTPLAAQFAKMDRNGDGLVVKAELV